MKRVAGVCGWSGSGKTTLIERAIRLLVAKGTRVAAIKHTHHPVNEEHRGDTGRFRDAGASPVVLAGKGEAVFFSELGTARAPYATAEELVDRIEADVIVIEGFKQTASWPLLDLNDGRRREPEELLELIDRIGSS